MITTSRALVLHTIKYNDDKLIAECLTREEGHISFVIRITHNRHAKVRHTYFRPLALLNLIWKPRPHGGMPTPQYADIAQPWITLHSLPKKAAILLFLADFMLQLSRCEQTNAHLFDYTAHALQWLDAAPKDYANFHLVFLMRMARFVGISPDVGHVGRPYFDLQAGMYVSGRPTHPYFVDGAESAAFASLMRMDFATMRLFTLSRRQRSRILSLILDYYRLHLPAMAELKSPEVLGALFD